MTDQSSQCGWVAVLICSAIAFCATWLMTRLSIPLLGRLRVIDVPGPRSSHDEPTPRGGGISLALGWIAALGAWSISCGSLELQWPFWMGLVLVLLAGVLDDLTGGVSIRVRLLAQTLAAILVVTGVGRLEGLPWPAPADIELGFIGQVLTIVWIVGVINLYNFLDGIDGYAAVQGVIAGIGLALVSGRVELSVLALAAAGSCLGFLPYNWHRAKVFLGDSGSSFLGYLFAVIPLLAPADRRPDLVLLMSLFLWFFLADGTFTLLRRTFRRERIWKAHRSHLYQRLVQTGLRHDQVVLPVALLMAIVSGLAVFAARQDSQKLLLLSIISAIVLFLVLVVWVLRRESRLRAESDSTQDG